MTWVVVKGQNVFNKLKQNTAGESGTNCNTTEFEIIHNENQQLKKELRIITNYTRKLETNLNILKSDHELLKNLTFSHMGG